MTSLSLAHDQGLGWAVVWHLEDLRVADSNGDVIVRVKAVRGTWGQKVKHLMANAILPSILS